MRNLSAQNRADIALIVVAIVWGATFLPMANALKTNGVFVMLFCRFFLSAIFVVFLTNAMLSLVFAFFQGSIVPNFDREFFIAIFITTVIGTIFCYFVQTIAQRYTTASKAALFFCLEPVSAGLIGYFFAGEILSIWQIFGTMLIIFGVIFSEFGK